MEEEFVTFEIAKELMELGYNKPALGCYETMAGIFNTVGDPWGGKKLIIKKQEYPSITSILAPLWQQAIDYMQEEHKWYVYQIPTHKIMGRGTSCWAISQAPNELGAIDDIVNKCYGETNYDARLKALKEAIYRVKIEN